MEPPRSLWNSVPQAPEKLRFLSSMQGKKSQIPAIFYD